MGSPVRSISIARARPTARSTSTMGVVQNRPMRTPGVAKAAVLGRDGEIARRHQLAPGRRGEPLDAGDDRHLQRVDREHELGAEGEDALVGGRVARGQLAQVVAGAEDRPLGADDHGAHGRIGAGLAEPIAQGGHGGRRERVAPLRPAQHERGDVPVAADGDGSGGVRASGMGDVNFPVEAIPRKGARVAIGAVRRP